MCHHRDIAVLHKLGAQKHIKTVYGIGYSWVTKDE